jgi:type I restriction enzyme S subunit
MVESELGLIPEGWEIRALNDEIESIRGLSYKGSGLSDSGIPLHNLNSVLEGGGYKFAGIKYYNGDFKEKHRIFPGDIIVTNTEQGFEYRLIGFPAIVPRVYGEEGIFSHHIFRVRPHPASGLTRSFIYYLLMTDVVRHQIIAYANGTTVNMLSIDGLKFPKFVKPPENFIELFDNIAQPIFDLIESYTEKNANLRSTRDLLLPRLISGKLGVCELDIKIPEAMT